MDAPSVPTIGSPLLLPFDGSVNAEAVIPFVPVLANGRREVILLQVVPDARSVRGPRGDVMLSAAELRQASEAAARTSLADAAARLADLDPTLQIAQVVASGEPSQQIAAAAARYEVRAILMATQGVSATGPGGFGSVVGRVVNIAPAPVIVVQPSGHHDEAMPVARFVVAHDGSERAGRALPVVQDLAQRLSAHVHVVTVVEDEESPLAAGVAAGIDPHLRDEVHGDALNAARRHLEVAGARLLRQGLPASWQVLSGPAATAIIDACAPRDVLVITSHGRSGARWPLGSVAEKLVRESPVPVLLLRTPPEPAEDPPA